nr:unnamed protein product [Callosobruchus analis]
MWLDEEEKWLYYINGYNSIHTCRDKRGRCASISVRDSIRLEELEVGKNIVSEIDLRLKNSKTRNLKKYIAIPPAL